MKKKVILVLVILIVCGIGLYYGIRYQKNISTKAKTSTITVGYRPILPSLDLFVALEKGYFKDENLEVKLEVFRGSDDLANAVIIGSVDFASDLGMVTQLLPIFRTGNYSTKILTLDLEIGDSLFRGACLVVKKELNVKSVKDLKGKTIGMFPGVNFQIMMKALLQHYKMDYVKDVSIVEIPPQEQVPAFKSLDALLSIDPIIQILEKQGVGIVIEDHICPRYIFDPFIPAGTNVNANFAKRNPEVVKRTLRAISRAIEFTRTNPQESKMLLVKYANLSPELAEIQEIVPYAKYEEIDISDVQKVVDYLQSLDWLNIKKNLDSEKLIWKE